MMGLIPMRYGGDLNSKSRKITKRYGIYNDVNHASLRPQMLANSGFLESPMFSLSNKLGFTMIRSVKFELRHFEKNNLGLFH